MRDTTHMHDHSQVTSLLQQPFPNATNKADDGFTLHSVVDDDGRVDQVVDETSKHVEAE